MSSYGVTFFDRQNASDSIAYSIAERWTRLKLGTQFLIASSVVILIGMTAVGSIVLDRIRKSAVLEVAGSAALFIDGVIDRHFHVSADKGIVVKQDVEPINRLLSTNSQSEIVSVVIWSSDGELIFAAGRNSATLAVRDEASRLKSPLFRKALSGHVEAEFVDPDQTTAFGGQSLYGSDKIIKIWAPVRDKATGNVEGIVEFYAGATRLLAAIEDARRHTALAVGAIALAMAFILSAVFRNGSKTIEVQREALESRVSELGRLLQQNEKLQSQIVDAGKRYSQSNERALRRLGAELHDGPSQLLALALLRLGEPTRATADASIPSDAHDITTQDFVSQIVRDAMGEIRDICHGLTLPGIESLTLSEVVELAVRNHQKRTGSRVALDMSGSVEQHEPLWRSNGLKATIYRFVQEGLNNAFRHAGGIGQKVSAIADPETLTIEVEDAGGGCDCSQVMASTGRLGLCGIRDRVEAVGGSFDMQSSQGTGTMLRARFSHCQEVDRNV